MSINWHRINGHGVYCEPTGAHEFAAAVVKDYDRWTLTMTTFGLPLEAPSSHATMSAAKSAAASALYAIESVAPVECRSGSHAWFEGRCDRCGVAA